MRPPAAPGLDRTGNGLLAALPAEDYARLLPHLELVSREAQAPIYEPNEFISHVYFPVSGVVSLLVVRSQGGAIEAGMIGREGFVGLPVLLGTDRSPIRMVVQLPLRAMRMTSDAFRTLVPRDSSLHALLLRYTHFLLCQISQSLACCAAHAVEKRLCRWMLMLHDRAENDEFYLTHAFMANMMGVRRASVSEVAAGLQQRGLIRYDRGRLTVQDRIGLERAACGCFRQVQAEWERLFQ
jgi:CRP-like cAMP-binding protein